jgi:K+-transporting ATPase ATPase B chain
MLSYRKPLGGIKRFLTTFSLAAELGKYVAIIPVVFATTYPGLNALNVAQLANPRRAILSALIFNILIMVPFLLFALRGVKARAPWARVSRATTGGSTPGTRVRSCASAA